MGKGLEMNQKSLNLLAIVGLVTSMLALPGAAFAQTELQVDVATAVDCDQASFQITVAGGGDVHDVTIEFGDSEGDFEAGVSEYPLEFDHTYPASGDFAWSVMAVDSADPELTGTAQGTLSVGPSVTLTSEPFPPLLTLSEGSAEVTFMAEVEGGEPPYSFSWDLEGHGSGDDSGTATASYSEAGKYSATVTVTDACGLTASDTLPVVVLDPEDACHPMAQRIAEAVSSLFPDQADDLYSCEDIFGIFNGDLTDSQLGFGRMWHAYQLSQTIEDLTWEEILAWHLDQGGWGQLVQLDRFADTLSDVGIRDLTAMVVEGEASLNEIRAAVRAVARYEADFEDALMRLQDGASPGELGQFYRLVQESGLDAETLDSYLESGLRLSDIRHASRLADRNGSDLDTIVDARRSGASWGEIGQAFRLADEDTSAQEILEMGVKAYREAERAEKREARNAERDSRRIERLADQYGVSVEDVQALMESCDGDLKCVRDELRGSSRDERTAERLAAQYGVSVEQVQQLYENECAQDWSCVRKTLRDQAKESQGRGNKKND